MWWLKLYASFPLTKPLAHLFLPFGMQGAFVLIGKGATGIYILIVMAVALATYIIWRFWEGVTAQVSLNTWEPPCCSLRAGHLIQNPEPRLAMCSDTCTCPLS